ncbi:MAG: hypothetical protein AVDCRST_MAG89-5348, partial [uncultured Gemmatimonadetes bacterium]
AHHDLPAAGSAHRLDRVADVWLHRSLRDGHGPLRQPVHPRIPPRPPLGHPQRRRPLRHLFLLHPRRVL